jgi:hypothetical protein
MRPGQKELLDLFEQLGAAQRETLLAFAGFLVARQGNLPAVPPAAPVVIPPPEPIERPAAESIVAALKRLARTYPMLDKSEMLGATSDLVATSIMQGGDTVPVIDELEEIFATHYRQLQEAQRSE